MQQFVRFVSSFTYLFRDEISVPMPVNWHSIQIRYFKNPKQDEDNINLFNRMKTTYMLTELFVYLAWQGMGK